MDNERTQWAARMLTLPEPLQSRLMPAVSALRIMRYRPKILTEVLRLCYDLKLRNISKMAKRLIFRKNRFISKTV